MPSTGGNTPPPVPEWAREWDEVFESGRWRRVRWIDARFPDDANPEVQRNELSVRFDLPECAMKWLAVNTEPAEIIGLEDGPGSSEGTE